MALKDLPVLILQGKDDAITTVENALCLYENIACNSSSSGGDSVDGGCGDGSTRSEANALTGRADCVGLPMKHSSFKLVENAGREFPPQFVQIVEYMMIESFVLFCFVLFCFVLFLGTLTPRFPHPRLIISHILNCSIQTCSCMSSPCL